MYVFAGYPAALPFCKRQCSGIRPATNAMPAAYAFEQTLLHERHTNCLWLMAYGDDPYPDHKL